MMSGIKREVPIPEITTDLATYLANHPLKDNPDAPLWLKR
jgi:hypothetical protein